MERCPKYKLSEGKEEGQGGQKRNKDEGRGGARKGRPSHHPADEGLHHEGVLEVADGVAVLGPSLVDPWERREKLSEDCTPAQSWLGHRCHQPWNPRGTSGAWEQGGIGGPCEDTQTHPGTVH